MADQTRAGRRGRAWWRGLACLLLLAVLLPAAASAQEPPAEVLGVGGAPLLGSTAGLALAAPVVGVATTPTGGGYWTVAADGGVFSFGDARFHGSTGALRLVRPIVGIAPTPSGGGYWLVAADGGVFAFGDAPFLGSTGGLTLVSPVVGMAPTRSGRGYWLVAADGGVFAFGDAPFLGSMGGRPLNEPVVGMAPTPSGRGYWLVARDGGVFAFGDAPFAGSLAGGTAGGVTATGVAATAEGGYLVVGLDGAVAAFAPGLAPRPLAGPAPAPGLMAVGVAPAPGGGAWVALARIPPLPAPPAAAPAPLPMGTAPRALPAPGPDQVTVVEGRELGGPVRDGALRAAADAGASATVLHDGVLGLLGVWRAGSAVQLPPAGMRFPMSTTAVDPGAAASVMSGRVANTLRAGQLAMGETTAALRGARAGDELELLGWNGTIARLRVGVVVPDAEVRDAELAVSVEVAARMGMVRPAAVVLWGFPSRAAVDAALERRLPSGVRWRVRRTWDPPNPDAVLSTARLKAALGEFAYRGSGWDVVPQAGWVGGAIVRESVPIIGTISCHRVVMPAVRGALAEVQASGLAPLIDVRDTQRAGGCYHAREIVSGGSTTGGRLSRHSWGAALDLNPSTNAFGATPRMDPRVIEIFRRWGFAWGGSFVIPDGMHFEWVGEPRA